MRFRETRSHIPRSAANHAAWLRIWPALREEPARRQPFGGVPLVLGICTMHDINLTSPGMMLVPFIDVPSYFGLIHKDLIACDTDVILV